MSAFREAYKRYNQQVRDILSEPTEEQLAGILPAFHQLKHKDNTPLTKKELHDWAESAWFDKQVADIVRLVMEAQNG